MVSQARVDVVLTGLGTVLAGLGTAAWAVTLAVFEPALSTFYHSAVDAGGANQGRFVPNDVEALFAFGMDLRWASIALAVAGVLLVLSGSRWRGRLAGPLVVGWFGADLLLDRLDVVGWLAAVGVGVVAAAVVGYLVRVGRRHGDRPPEFRPGSIVYSGALIALVAVLAPRDAADMFPDVPGGLVVAAVVVPAALAFAAVVLGASAVRPVSGVRLAITGVVALVAVTAAVVNAALLADPVSTYGSSGFTTYAVFGTLPVALALLAGPLPLRRLPVTVIAAVAAPVVGFVAFYVALFGGALGAAAMRATGDGSAYLPGSWAFGGLAAGVLGGALGVVVRGIDDDVNPAALDPDNPPPDVEPARPSPARWL
jgi:hypothetical protein